MKYIKQISTGKSVFREEPHSDKTLPNASKFLNIDISDLAVVEEALDNNAWAKKYENDRPWEERIASTDSSMPRYLEDHIKDDHDGVASNEFLQAKYDDKKALRATKP